AVELPTKGGGGTSVADMRAGYDGLPADLKARVDAMQTVNVMVGSAVVDGYGNTDTVVRQRSETQRDVLHPLVRTHPANGRKALYFHPSKTENIVGMSPEASQTFLDDLLEKAVRPDFVYSHQYRLGDMLLWDNRAAMHKA